MQFHYTPYIFTLLAATAISAWIAYYGWRRRAANHAILLSVLSLALTEWLIFYILQIAGTNLHTKLVFGEVKYLGVAATPLLWFLFAFQYENQGKKLNWRFVLPLAIVPLLTSILAMTTGWHGLFWSEPHLTFGRNFSDFDVTYGPWYWVHVTYSYLLILAGTVIVFRAIRQRKGLHRRQAVALIVAVLAPWLGNILYFSGFNPIRYLDLTPFAFTITVSALTWAILGFRLVEIVPIARDLVVDEMKDGMLVLDAQGFIADINLSAERMIGLSASEVIGKPVSDALSAWPDLVERYSQVMDALDEISIGQGADASWFELRFSSLQDRRGQFLGRVVVMRDITARKNTEKALSTALEQAQEASRLKSQLLARVSHELRTPLGSILGFAELLNMNSFGVLDDSQKAATAQIIESSNYLDRIINELLDQAELDSNALILQNVPFYLRDVVQKVKEEMSDFASAKGLDFHVNLASDFPKAIYGDQQRIRQILAILVHNAIKFTSEGRVDLHIQRFGANYWEIKVSDTGSGIPEEAQSYIFESFRQVNPMITSENRGAGLGLSIARQLTELMKGEIRLESKPGRGSTFIVTLPLMEQTA